MKRVYNNYFLVGLFTLIIGGLAIFMLLNMSGKNKDAETYYSYFSNVTGLGYGNPVYYEGYRVGQVEKINPETVDGKLLFRTEYTLLKGWKIPNDSFTKIASSGLLSDMSLNISAGASQEHFIPNSEIKGVLGDDIMATVSQLAADFENLNKDKITPLFDLIYERTDTLTKSLAIQIPEILTSTHALIKDTNKLVISAHQVLHKGNIANLDKIVANIEKLTQQISSTGGWLESSFSNINELIDSGDKLVNNSDTKMAKLLDITIKMLEVFSIKADTIGNEIESASMNINEATDLIRKKPSSLIFKEKSKQADEDL